MTRYSLPLVLAVTITAGAACDAELAPPDFRVESKLQQVLDRGVGKPDVLLPGATAYYRSPPFRAWVGAAGLGDRAARVAMRPQDHVRAGSILKTLIATVTLQHVEQGALSLDQKLPELLPPEVTARIAHADQITLRMLLSHTSGIPEWTSEETDARVALEPAYIWTTEEALELSARRPPTFAPGTGWSYANTNYTLIGLVLDRLGGKSWRAQVRERVIDRLGLTSTHLPEAGDPSWVGDHARGYQAANGQVFDLTAVDPSMAGAAGGNAMETTAQDLGRFLDALLAGQLFSRPGTLAAMTSMVNAPHETGLPHRYGLGLEEFDLNGVNVIGHGGGAAGYGVMMFRIPSLDTTLVTAANAGDLGANAVELFMPALQAIAESRR
jgi:D-alanyl-D-alanine carboxypeptidase